MKRIFIVVLVLQFATGHNLVAELVRMPSLLEHFQTHRQETPDLSFVHFLWMHYSESSHSHTDNSHAQLPLHCSHGIMAESVLPQPPAVEYVFSFQTTDRVSLPLHAETLLPNDFSFGLFRPPIA